MSYKGKKKNKQTNQESTMNRTIFRCRKLRQKQTPDIFADASRNMDCITEYSILTSLIQLY